MPRLVPVDHDPFAPSPKGRNLVPVEHDPFIASETAARAAAYAVDKARTAETLAGQPAPRSANERLMDEFKAGAGDLGYGAANLPLGVAQLAKHMTPDRFENKETTQQFDAYLENREAARAKELKDTGREAVGRSLEFIGEAALPGAGLSKLKTAATKTGRIVQGLTVGGGFGAAQPVTTQGDYVGQKVVQTGTSALLAAVLAAGVEAAPWVAGKVGNIVNAMTKSGHDRIAGNLLNKAAGDKQAEIVKALIANKQIVPGSQQTTAEIAVPYQQPVFSALEANVSRHAPTEFNALDRQRKLARMQAVSSVAGTPRQYADAEAARAAATGPMRETALGMAQDTNLVVPALEKAVAANLPKATAAKEQAVEMAIKAGRAQMAAENFVPIPGFPRIAPQYAPVGRLEHIATKEADKQAALSLSHGKKAYDAQAHLSGMENAGIAPIRFSDFSSKIAAAGRRRGVTELEEKSLQDFGEKLARRAASNKDGMIHPEDIYTARKEAGLTIQRYAKEFGNFDQKLTAGLEKNVQGWIDDAIEGAGGVGWRDYLATYGKMTKPLEQMRIGQALKTALRDSATGETPGKFLRLLDDERKLLGNANIKRGSLSDKLEKPAIKALAQVGGDLDRTLANKSLATKGATVADGLIGGNVHMPTSPRTLEIASVIFNRMMNALGGKAQTGVTAVLGRAALNPPVAAGLMQNAAKNAATNKAIAEALFRASKYGAGGAGYAAGSQF